MNMFKVLFVLVSIVFASGCAGALPNAAHARDSNGFCTKSGASSDDKTACLEEKNEALQKQLEDVEQRQQAQAKDAAATTDRRPSAPVAAPALFQQPSGMIVVPQPMGASGYISTRKQFRVDNYTNDTFLGIPAGMQPFNGRGGHGKFVFMRVQVGGHIENRWVIPPRTSATLVPQIETSNTMMGPVITNQGPDALVFDVYEANGNLPLTRVGQTKTIQVQFPFPSDGFVQNYRFNDAESVAHGT